MGRGKQMRASKRHLWLLSVLSLFVIALTQGAALEAGNRRAVKLSHDRVQELAAAPAVIRTYAGTGIRGFSGDGGPAIAAQLNTPTDVAVDAAGNLYIVDSGNYRVRRVTPDGVIGSYAGNGRPNYGGDGGLAINAGINPARVAVDAAGNLYLSDGLSGRVRKITASTGIITTIAGNGVLNICVCGGDGGVSITCRDAQDNLYIADTGNHRLRKVTMSTGMISAVAGSGAQGFSGDGGDPLMAQFNWAADVTIDAAGNLYIADQGNHRVRKVTLPNSVATLTAVSAASFSGGTLAEQSIAAAFGVNLAATT